MSKPPDGDTFSHQTIHVAGLYYRNCVKIIIAPGGLYLSVAIPFPWSAGERAMIPWDQISYEGDEGGFLWRHTRLKVRGVEPVYITIPQNIGRRLPIT